MINSIIKLEKPGLFLRHYANLKANKTDIIVSPKILAICAADLRYFFGKRDKDILKKKLPMSLFHEAVGEILYSPFHDDVGKYCVLLPGGINTVYPFNNYAVDSTFRSSNRDGFCQEIVSITKNELIVIKRDNPIPYVLCEPISVCVQAIRRYLMSASEKQNTNLNFAVWGDGNIGYLMALTIRYFFLNSHISIFGKHEEKLNYFSFCNDCINIYESELNNFENYFDVIFECVGGNSSQQVIDEGLRLLKPMGHMVLTGVSEKAVNIYTRRILEKGITLIGSSRSDRNDFIKSIDLIDSGKIDSFLNKLITQINIVKNECDLTQVFTDSKNTLFKTVIKLDI